MSKKNLLLIIAILLICSILSYVYTNHKIIENTQIQMVKARQEKDKLENKLQEALKPLNKLEQLKEERLGLKENIDSNIAKIEELQKDNSNINIEVAGIEEHIRCQRVALYENINCEDINVRKEYGAKK